MKVDIVIPSYNSFEAIQLAIESIRYYTRYPDYRIIVYEDYSLVPNEDGSDRERNMVDLSYLRECQEKGWIELHENPGPQLTHGGSLNRLVNEISTADYVAIIDSDIQIKGYNWLVDMVNKAALDPKILAVVDWRAGGFARRGYRTAIYLFWFGLLNMKAYHDGMEVDWMLSKPDRRDWPYYEEFKDGYPPENSKWTAYFNESSWIMKDKFDSNLVINDPGSKLYIKVKYYNPKGYRVVPLPPQTRAKYYHYGHLSMISVLGDNAEPHHFKQRKERFAKVRAELATLRGMTAQ